MIPLTYGAVWSGQLFEVSEKLSAVSAEQFVCSRVISIQHWSHTFTRSGS